MKGCSHSRTEEHAGDAVVHAKKTDSKGKGKARNDDSEQDAHTADEDAVQDEKTGHKGKGKGKARNDDNVSQIFPKCI